MKFFYVSSEGKKSGSILFILSVLLFLYVAVRSYMLSFTWDEAYSYLEFINKGLFSPFYFNGTAANNHLLNTWLSYVTSSLFGINEFNLRIPNLLAYILFLFFTAKISNEFSSPLLRISSFLILNLNPYLIDFFSLSRGYGLAFGLMSGSLWYLYLFFKKNYDNKFSLRSLLFGMIAVVAYLSLINFVITLFLIILLTDLLIFFSELKFFNSFFYTLKKNSAALILFIAFLLIVIPRAIGLRNAEALFYGGDTGFWNDTMLTVFEQSFYGHPYPGFLKYLLSALSILIVLIALIIAIKRIYLKIIRQEKLYLPVLVFLLLSCSVATIVQFYLLKTPYLTNRTALYLLVLFSFLLVVLFNELAQAKKIIGFVLPLLSILMILHFYKSFNLKYVFEYYLNADMKEMMHDADSLKTIFPPEKFSADVGMSYDFVEPFNYYRCVNNLTLFNVADKANKFHPLNDLYLFTEKDLMKINTDSFELIKNYPLNNCALMKRKYKPSHYTICFSLKQDYDSHNDSMPLNYPSSKDFFYSGKASSVTNEKKEFSEGIRYMIDSSKASVKNSMLIIKAMILMESLKNLDAGIVISFENTKGIYDWHETLVKDFAQKSQKWFPVYISCMIPEQVQQDDLLLIYLWNKKSSVYIDDLEVRWLTGVN
ncbi:MAG: hypothetical protein ABIT08_17215 [Bacteroidia bacterium]